MEERHSVICLVSAFWYGQKNFHLRGTSSRKARSVLGLLSNSGYCRFRWSSIQGYDYLLLSLLPATLPVLSISIASITLCFRSFWCERWGGVHIRRSSVPAIYCQRVCPYSFLLVGSPLSLVSLLVPSGGFYPGWFYFILLFALLPR